MKQDAAKIHALASPIRRYAGDVVRYLPMAVLPAMFGIAGALVFTRVFSPEEYGLYGVALAVLAPLTTVLTEWIAQPAGRFYAEFEHSGRLPVFFRTVLLLVLMMAILAGVGGLLVTLVLPSDGPTQRLLLISSAVLIVLQTLYATVVRILPASLNTSAYRLVTLVVSGISIGVPLALIAGGIVDVSWLVWGIVLSLAAATPYVYWQTGMAQHLRQPVAWGEVRATVRRFAQYGLPMMLWFFASSLLSVGDRYVIQSLLGSAEVGIYTVNYGLVAQAVGLANTALLTASFPILSYQWTSGRREEVQRTIAQMTDIYLIFGCAMLGGVVVVGRPLIELLLGEGFHEGFTVLTPALVGLVAWGVSVIGHKTIELAERTELMVGAALLAALANLVLNLLFVPIYGYVAAAYTTCVAYVLYGCAIWWLSRRFTPWLIPWSGLARSVAAAGLGSVCGLAAMQLLDLALLQILGGAMVFLGVYIASLSVLRPGDLAQLRRLPFLSGRRSG